MEPFVLLTRSRGVLRDLSAEAALERVGDCRELRSGATVNASDLVGNAATPASRTYTVSFAVKTMGTNRV